MKQVCFIRGRFIPYFLFRFILAGWLAGWPANILFESYKYFSLIIVFIILNYTIFYRKYRIVIFKKQLFLQIKSILSFISIIKY